MGRNGATSKAGSIRRRADKGNDLDSKTVLAELAASRGKLALRRAFLVSRLATAGEQGVLLEELLNDIIRIEGKPLKLESLKDNLDALNDDLRGYSSTIERQRDRAVLLRPDPILLVHKASSQPWIKRKLGRIVWQIVYGIAYEDLSREYTLDTQLLSLWNRALAIRQKAVSTVFLDNGSTTLSTIDALLECKKIPVPVEVDPPSMARRDPNAERAPHAPGKDGRGNTSARLFTPPTQYVAPRIVTNSPAIVASILRSSHRPFLPNPIIVGGEVQDKNGSVAGSLAEAFLRQSDLRADVAVLGATGYVHADGGGGLGSESIPDRDLKKLFLDRATLRVVVCDSTKLSLFHEAFTVFAPLSTAHVDLVVTDDGVATGHDEGVQRFREAASAAQIVTAVLKTRDKRGEPAGEPIVDRSDVGNS